jgi:isopentenyldiphosphate isomerase
MKSSNYSLNKSSICLFLLRNNDTQVLLQKRGKNSSFAPNMWEAGAAGHVDKGESVLDAVLHEAKEELCISVKKNDLQFGSVTNKRSAITGEIFYIFSFFCRK